MDDWRKNIIILCQVKQRLFEVNAGKRPLWPFCYPEDPATPDELRLAETVLGFQLDPLYLAFLSHADGWAAFFQKNDLFGTADLVGGLKHDRADQLLASL